METELVIVLNDDNNQVTVKEEHEILGELNRLRNENQSLKGTITKLEELLPTQNLILEKRQTIDQLLIENQKCKEEIFNLKKLNSDKQSQINQIINDFGLCKLEIKRLTEEYHEIKKREIVKIKEEIEAQKQIEINQLKLEKEYVQSLESQVNKLSIELEQEKDNTYLLKLEVNKLINIKNESKNRKY